MSLNNKILVKCNWITLLFLFCFAGCHENKKEVQFGIAPEQWEVEYESNKALISYAKKRSQVFPAYKKHFFQFVYPPDTTYNFISRRHYTSDSSFIDYEILRYSSTGLQNSMYFEIKNGH